jgi:alkylhydroperoxidase/carboxymuconolactone decarboxylase family protein YurZ
VDVTDEAWVRLPNDDEMRAMGYGSTPHPYDFGFIPGMARLRMAHRRIGPAMTQLFREVMFAPGALTRAEREMIAAVTAAVQDCRY